MEGVPRTRGDGPTSDAPAKRLDQVFPAHAGMDRQVFVRGGADLQCSLHTRGWTARGQTAAERPIGVPRTRGDGPGLETRRPSSSCVFPAHAGMDHRALDSG